ncbi:polysaccharide biosynthesis protein [Vibrio cholerae]|nr:polysaccharide biosynthesis protein [Vibrio cholerae]
MNSNSRLVPNLRTKTYLTQLKGSFIFKGLAIILSFFLVPLMLEYLGAEKYGIWSTLLSMIFWILIFDFGIGNGLRNKLSESIVKNDWLAVREYISTAYFAVACIAIFLCSIFYIISSYISWNYVFNTNVVSNSELRLVVNISFLFVSINFFFSIINQVLNSSHKTDLVVFNQFLSNGLSLLFVFFLKMNTSGDMKLLALIYGISLFLSNLCVSVFFYGTNRNYMPSIFSISKHKLPIIISLGGHFFIIQLAVLILFTTDRILITHLIGPEYVTPYDIVFKLFSVVTIVHSVIVAPLWNSYSDAFYRKDLRWIKKMMGKQIIIFGCLFFLALILLLSSPYIIFLWVGAVDNLNFTLILVVFLYSMVLCWNNIFALFINATGYLRLSLIINIALVFLNIPLSVFMVKYFIDGPESIVLATILCLLIGAFLGPIQCLKIINKTGDGIWVR